MSKDYLAKAEELAKTHLKAGGNTIKEVYLFPDPEEQEIRLVEIDPTTIPSQGEIITVWHFGQNSVKNIPYRLALAVILPEEKSKLNPPAKWVPWKDAQKLFPKPRTIRRKQ